MVVASNVRAARRILLRIKWRGEPGENMRRASDLVRVQGLKAG